MEDTSKSPPDLPSREYVAQALDQLLRLSARWVVRHLRSRNTSQVPKPEVDQPTKDADA